MLKNQEIHKKLINFFQLIYNKLIKFIVILYFRKTIWYKAIDILTKFRGHSANSIVYTVCNVECMIKDRSPLNADMWCSVCIFVSSW